MGFAAGGWGEGGKQGVGWGGGGVGGRAKVISSGAADNPFCQHRPERAPTYAIKTTGDILIHNPLFICDCLHQEIACIIRPDLE